MNNLSSYCWLVDARISASDKYLPVLFAVRGRVAPNGNVTPSWVRLDKKVQNHYGIWKCEKNLRQISLCALYVCVQMFIVTNNLFLYLVSKLVLLKQQNSEDGRIS